MSPNRYEHIYRDLKDKIESGEIAFQEFLPSEHILTATYDCSRNTVRRALSMLINDGYIQSIQGKGVRCIFCPIDQASFFSSEIETFRESASRNHLSYSTRVMLFTEITIDEKLHNRLGFPVGETVYYIQRVHYIDGKALILNHNYFLKSAVGHLTPQIAEASIYDYLENELKMNIVNSKRTFTVEKITSIDEKYLELNPSDYNCLAVVSSQTFNSDGIMFEYTQSRHRPDYFRFTNTAIRRK